MKEYWVLQKPWNITRPWLILSKCYILVLWSDCLTISLSENNIGEEMTTIQRIKNALEINRNFLKIWTQRKNFITFLSQLSSDTLSLMLPSDNVDVRRVLELEEMKREIMNFLWCHPEESLRYLIENKYGGKRRKGPKTFFHLV